MTEDCSAVPESHRRRQSCKCLRQANIQRVELDLRWDVKEFPAALDRSSHLKPLPGGVEVWPNGHLPGSAASICERNPTAWPLIQAFRLVGLLSVS